jgi:hypothetical protein
MLDQSVPFPVAVFAHTLLPCALLTTFLCIAVTAALLPHAKLLAKCRRIVGFFHRSVVGKHALLAAQKLTKEAQTSLIQDVKTRWMATYDMGKSIMGCWKAINIALEECRDNVNNDNEQEGDNLVRRSLDSFFLVAP